MNGLSRHQGLPNIEERRNVGGCWMLILLPVVEENMLKVESNVRCSLGRCVRNADEAEYHQGILEDRVRVVLVTPRLARLDLHVVNFQRLDTPVATPANNCEQQPGPGGPPDRLHGESGIMELRLAGSAP